MARCTADSLCRNEADIDVTIVGQAGEPQRMTMCEKCRTEFWRRFSGAVQQNIIAVTFMPIEGSRPE